MCLTCPHGGKQVARFGKTSDGRTSETLPFGCFGDHTERDFSSSIHGRVPRNALPVAHPLGDAAVLSKPARNLDDPPSDHVGPCDRRTFRLASSRKLRRMVLTRTAIPLWISTVTRRLPPLLRAPWCRLYDYRHLQQKQWRQLFHRKFHQINDDEHQP